MLCDDEDQGEHGLGSRLRAVEDTPQKGPNKGIVIGVEYADAIENSLKAMKLVTMDNLEVAVEIIRDKIRKHDEIADDPMKDSTKRLAIMRVRPQVGIDHISAQTRPATYHELEDKVLT